tara:strand:- start:211 stop:522 length:312 start_codon:yes stop_codon:yes gene_type:complete
MDENSKNMTDLEKEPTVEEQEKDLDSSESFIQKLLINISRIINFIYCYFVPIILIYTLYYSSPSFKNNKIYKYILYIIFILYLLCFFYIVYEHIMISFIKNSI